MNNVKTIFIDKDKFNSNPDCYIQLITQILPFDTLEPEDIREHVNNDGYFCLLLVGDDVASICRISPVDKKEKIYINRPIVTSEEYQGMGYATMCLLESEKHLQALGCKKLISFVDKGNIASISLHKKAGYEIVQCDSIYKKSRYAWATAIMFEKVLGKERILTQ